MIKLIKNLFFSQSEKADTSLNIQRPTHKIKVCVVDFVDNVESNCASLLCSQLSNIENLDVIYYKESVYKEFLNLDAKYLFDFIDTGLDVLYKTNADVLIWGIREQDTIRLHFQNEDMFSATTSNFVSILDSLYIPSSENGFSSSIINLVYGAILSAYNPNETELKIIKKYWLKKVISSLSKDNSAKGVSQTCTPYILNFLGLIYLTYTSYEINEKDYKITSSLFENALSYQGIINNQMHLGRMYIHLAELNDLTANSNKARPLKFLARAIENYRNAQRYENKYNFPYDYGYVCYRLSKLFFMLFKEKNDVQSLRDCVFQLREAEKVFTHPLFPEFWGELQSDLGHKLCMLGSLTDSQEILELSIAAYRNQQKLITEKTDAIGWAKIQEQIGKVYYLLGKNGKNNFLEQALEYFHDALYIFENANMAEEIKNINIAIVKSSRL